MSVDRRRRRLAMGLALLPALPVVGASAHPHGPGSGGVRAPEPPFPVGARVRVRLAQTAAMTPQAIAYYRDLLAVALDAAGVGHDFETVTVPTAPDSPAGWTGSGANVMVAPPRREWQETLRPVYFPVHRGLPGLRLLLARADALQSLAAADDMAGLRGLTAAVRRGSGDAEVFGYQRLPVIQRSEGMLLRAVADGEADYAALPPREALAAKARQDRGPAALTLEATPLLGWRGDALLYVAPQSEDLLSALDYGLMAAYRGGAIGRLQARSGYLADVIADARLKERRLIRLQHPTMPKALQRAPEGLWLRP